MTAANAHAKYVLPSEPKVLEILRRFGIKRARLFGSAARGELRPDSDIDVLVEFEGELDYATVLHLSEELERETGWKFDVLTTIHPRFLPYIEPELIELPL